MGVEFTRFGSSDRAENALLSELELHITQAPRSGTSGTGPYVIMLPGGSTPLRVYGRIQDTFRSKVHPAVHLCLSDDRYVPPESPDSNFGHIRKMAYAIGLPVARVLHVEHNGPLADAAREYDVLLEGLYEHDAVFALAILGIGDDGHTASLFSTDSVPFVGGQRGDDPPEQFAAEVPATGGFDRVTATAPFILLFRRLIFFATGEGKRDVLYNIARHPKDYPAGRLMLQHPAAEIWTDQGYTYE